MKGLKLISHGIIRFNLHYQFGKKLTLEVQIVKLIVQKVSLVLH